MKFNVRNIWVPTLVGVLGWSSYILGTCGVTRSCLEYEIFNQYSFTLFEPILLYSMAVAPLAIAVLFASNQAFKKWLLFSAWWLPLSILIIAIAPTTNFATLTPFPNPSKEDLAWLMGGLFTVISIVIIVRTNRTSRTKAS